MKIKILLILGVSIFLLTIFARGALAAKKKVPAVLPIVGAEPPGEYIGPSPVGYEAVSNCEDIDPDPELTILQFDVFGTTWYEYQKNGSMGRMIAVSNGPYGYRSGIWHRTEGPYGMAFPLYVDINCKDTSDHVAPFCGPSPLDGGTGINAGYAQAFFMKDGSEEEVFLYHRTAPPIGCWYSTLAQGEAGFPCDCYVQKLYDIPDYHDDYVSTTPNGMWPKGVVVYDGDKDSNFIHIVTTENNDVLGGDQTIAYQRCVFEGDPYDIVCYSLHAGQGPYRRSAGGGGSSETDPIAVFDTIKCISAVVVSSPVSMKVAIVYTKHREDSQINNDVIYCESPDNGDSWFAAHDVTPCVNITNYEPLDPEHAYTDVAACYDYNDSLHVVWNTGYYDSATGDFSLSKANLYHWSKKDRISIIAMAQWEETAPGAWNRNISKMSVSAKDPIYHPGGDPDSVYLFCTWTQFDTGDASGAGWSNGDIYSTVSDDAGDTWARPYNLTNTKTPDCAPGECLSEHWSSLAENMHGGDLHIQYICDRDAGGAVQNEGQWKQADVMYMHLYPLPANKHCQISYHPKGRGSFCDPPIGSVLNNYKPIQLVLKGLQNLGGAYEVTTDNPKVACIGNCFGALKPNDSVLVDLQVQCGTQEEFIAANIIIHSCMPWQEDEKFNTVKVHAVCSTFDYAECAETEVNNDLLSLWLSCKTEERVWEKRSPLEGKRVIYSGGVIVATSWQGDKVVGRKDARDTRTGASNFWRMDTGPDRYNNYCGIVVLHCEQTFICANNLDPPKHQKWWWISINKRIIMYANWPGHECPDDHKQQIIKHVWIKWDRPPVWWPDQSSYPGHENISYGVFADVDAPSDTGCLRCNKAGYDGAPDYIMWQRGYNADIHPEYEQYYVGLALTDREGHAVEPLAARNVLSREYVRHRPTQPTFWGWDEDSLYKLASIAGTSVQYPDSVDDRVMVLISDWIPPADSTDTTFEGEFILIEAFVTNGLNALEQQINYTRHTLVPELNAQCLFNKAFPPTVPLVCGDANLNGTVDLADAGYLITWLFLGGPPTYYGWPFCPGDANGNGTVDLADAGFIITWLFLGGPAPADCQPICP